MTTDFALPAGSDAPDDAPPVASVTPEDPQGLVINPDLLDAPADSPEVLPPGVYPVVAGPLPEGRTELFRCNGRIYSVPVVADPRLVFRFIRATRNGEAEVAMAGMMYDTLGAPIVDFLADNEDLTAEQMHAVMGAVQKYLMSAMKRAGLGN